MRKVSSHFSTVKSISLDEIKAQLLKSRIYSDKSVSELVKSIATLKLVKRDLIVDNGPKIFEISQKILGKTLSNSITKNLMGSYYIGGSSLEETLEKVKSINRHGIPVLSGFAIEHQKGLDYTHEEVKGLVQCYIDNIDGIKPLHEKNVLEVKFSALTSIDLLKKYTKGQKKLMNLIRNLEKTEKGRSFDVFIESLKKTGLEFTADEVSDMKMTLKAEDGFISDAWPAYAHVFSISKTCKPLARIAGFTAEDEKELIFLAKGLHDIVAHCKDRNVRCLLDAEQTYIQHALHSLSEQYCTMYNTKSKVICFNTIQNYLKESPQFIEEEIAKCKYLGIPLSLKLVRGAYIVEETQLAKDENRESPIWDNYDLTTASYHSNLGKLMSNLTPATEIFAASHNKDTIEFAMSYNSKVIQFGQLYGIGDHLTHWLNNNGFPVHKYLPFGDISIMVPYLLRRAQESKQMFKSTPLLEELLTTELKQRLKFWKKDNSNN